MRVGAYIDGLNVYYGGRHLCGRDEPGWRWLDIHGLVERLISRNATWTAAGAHAVHIAYCTALVSGQIDPGARLRQRVYVEALRSNSLVHVELGAFITRMARGVDADDGRLAKVEIQEEKGSDVNVASHLLIDLHTDRIDAAILITNDSDLRLPATHARSLIPVGTVNPRGTPTAGHLRGDRDEGPGGHWWYRLGADDFRSCQLPETVAGHRRPAAW